MNSSHHPLAFFKTEGPLIPGTRFHLFLPAFLCFALIWPFGGGWNSVAMMAGTLTPGANGTVRFKIGNNGNMELDVKTQNLAQPSSLTPPENTYVLWIQPPGQDAQNRGEMKVGSNEQAELKTEAPQKRFRIFITAEQNGQTQMPQGPTVLSADVTQH